MNCGLRVGPDGVEERENIKMEFGLNWKLAKEKVKTRNRRVAAKLQEVSECLVVENGERLEVDWTDRKSR